MNKYKIIIFWSGGDQALIADVPELLGCMAHSDTYDSALTNAKETIGLCIKTAKEFGYPVPETEGCRLAYA